jgi:hypothetical protein
MVVRAKQFHEFAAQTSDRLWLGPLSMVPNMLVQPIAAVEGGAVLAEIAEAGLEGRVADVGGPRREHLPDMARRLIRHRGQRRMLGRAPC